MCICCCDAVNAVPGQPDKWLISCLFSVPLCDVCLIDLATSQRGIELYSAFAKELPEGAVEVYAEATLKFSIMHTDVIKKFGRFPHRNAILGRESTPEESST